MDERHGKEQKRKAMEIHIDILNEMAYRQIL
jgi:hypothetical protein